MGFSDYFTEMKNLDYSSIKNHFVNWSVKNVLISTFPFTQHKWTKTKLQNWNLFRIFWVVLVEIHSEI